MSFPLFKGATRAPCMWSIPYPIFMMTLIFSIAIPMMIQCPPLALIGLVVVVIEHYICLYDEKAFRIFFLKIKYSGFRRMKHGKNSFYY